MFNPGLPPTLLAQYFTSTFVGDEELTPAEKNIARNFSGKRLKDFSTGRYCARKALAAIGHENAEILIGDEKQPIWPYGYVGSISHSGTMAGAVVGKASAIRSIGLDIETIGKIKPEMWRLIYTDTEKVFLNSFTGDELAYYTTLIFGFKESFYKLQYPLTHTYLNFTDVEVKLARNRFELQILKQFEGKKLLPNTVPLFHQQEKNQLLTLCYLS